MEGDYREDKIFKSKPENDSRVLNSICAYSPPLLSPTLTRWLFSHFAHVPCLLSPPREERKLVDGLIRSNPLFCGDQIMVTATQELS